MEDILKSGILGIVLVGTLFLASLILNKDVKEVPVSESQPKELSNKDNIHIPQEPQG